MPRQNAKDWEPTFNPAHGWEVSFSVKGKRFRRRLGIRDQSSRAIARKAAEALYAQAWQDHLSPPEIDTAPLFWQAAQGFADSGFEARFLPPLIQHFGPDTTIDQIDTAAIAAAGLAIYPNAAPETRARQVRTPVNAVINWARGHRPQPRTDRKRTRWLTPEEAERLITAAARLTLPRHSDPERETLRKIAALLGTGMRTGECFAADVADWNAPTCEIWIPATQTGAGKTALAARMIRLPNRAAKMIQPIPTDIDPKTGACRLFRTAYGKPIVLRQNGGGQMATAFNNARDAAGLGPDVTPHVLRHTWATWFYAQTRDFGQLLDFGGWAKADMANRYRKIAPADLADRLLDHGWDFRQHQETPQHGLRIIRNYK